jgi:uncharacterized membrane protein YfcA
MHGAREPAGNEPDGRLSDHDGLVRLLDAVASARFVSRQAYAPKAAVGLTIGGLPGVLLAAWIVRSLPLHAVRWLVIAVVLTSAHTLLRSWWRAEP